MDGCTRMGARDVECAADLAPLRPAVWPSHPHTGPSPPGSPPCPQTARSQEVEDLRLEVDSRRRTVAELAAAVDAQRTRASSRGSDAKAQARLERTVQQLQHKEGKLNGEAARPMLLLSPFTSRIMFQHQELSRCPGAVTVDRFRGQEELLYRDLCLLIK